MAQAAGSATDNNAPFVLESRQVIFTICRPVSEMVLFCFKRCRLGVTTRTGLCSRMGRRNWLGRMSTDSSSSRLLGAPGLPGKLRSARGSMLL